MRRLFRRTLENVLTLLYFKARKMESQINFGQIFGSRQEEFCKKFSINTCNTLYNLVKCTHNRRKNQIRICSEDNLCGQMERWENLGFPV